MVKGVQFKNLVQEGDPVELGQYYSDSGADELVFLDISASVEARQNVVQLAERVAREIFIPFTIGGGIRAVADVAALLMAGADKVAVNSAALVNPDIIGESAKKFGSQCMVIAVDVKRSRTGWAVFSHGGTRDTGRDALEWAREIEARGAGEILLTSMDADGTYKGCDLELTRQISSKSTIPVIASGGIGELRHFRDAFDFGRADAVLAASVFHRNQITIKQVKEYLADNNIPMRMMEED